MPPTAPPPALSFLSRALALALRTPPSSPMQTLLARQRGLLIQRLGQQQQQQPLQPYTVDSSSGRRRPVTAVAAATTTPPPPPPRHGELITSPSNRYVRHCVRLRDSPRHRWEHGSALLVGATLLGELAEAAGGGAGAAAAAARLPTLPNARVLFVPEDDEEKEEDHNDKTKRRSIASLAPPNTKCAVVRASRPVLRALAGVPTAGEGAEGEDRLAAAVVDISRDLVAYIKGAAASSSGSSSSSASSTAAAAADQAARVLMPPSTTTTTTTTPTKPLRLLALEGVQDPGNLGTLLRTAAAFGWRGAWLLPGCADPFGAKAVRAARGAQLRSPLVTGPGAGWDALEAFAAAHGARLVAAALPGQVGGDGDEAVEKKKERRGGGGDDGGNGTSTKNIANNIILVLGSEGQGLSAEALRRCDASLSVPMVEGAMESLNVAVAGGVLMFALGGGGGGGGAGGKRAKAQRDAVKTLLRDIDALF